LQVRLDDPTSPGNRSGIGARVVVTPKAGATKVVVPIATGGSYESQKEPVAHVGLGAATTAATVEVYWPGETSPQRLQDVPADQVLTVRRG
jgi:hypothetical protein